MQNSRKKTVCRIIFLAITVFVVFSSLSSCEKPYVAATKEEIESNVTSSKDEKYTYVATYLRQWGVPKFDKDKFTYFESCLMAVYNYGDGLPDAYEHAKMTVESFLASYYDVTDIYDEYTVTNALLTCYIEVLDDPYAVYREAVATDDYTEDMSGKFGGIGVVVEYDDEALTITVNTVYLGSPAEKAGIQVGDVIYAVDGKLVSDIGHRNAVYYIRGEIGSSVKLTLKRGEEFIETTATRDEVEELTVDYHFDEESNIGYVKMVAFKGNTDEQFARAIDELEKLGARGIIFDVRNNPGGYLDSVCNAVSYMIPNGNIIVTYKYKGALTSEIESETDYTDAEGNEVDRTISLPVVVICNEYTASAGEIFTAAVRDYRKSGILNATIVGTTTYKKGIMQNTYMHTDGSSVTMTVAYYDPPCGVNYHGIGVTPDVIVENKDGEDTQYKTAITELKKLINANNN